MIDCLKKFASMKVTCALLVAFLLLTFWGVLGQAAAGNEGAALATDRFFGSYFLWVVGVIPLPAFKGLAVLTALNLICSLVFRMPRGFRNAGLWGMHIALLVLIVGSLVGSELRQEYNGFRGVSGLGELQDVQSPLPIKFYSSDDSLATTQVKIAEGYPYYIFQKGTVDMFGVQVELYTATYDPFKFVPYAFMILFLLSAAFHYVAKVCRSHGNRVGPRTNVVKALPALLIVMAGLVCVPRANATEIIFIPDSVSAGVLDYPEDPVLVNGVLRPFDSFARGVLNEFSGRVTHKGSFADGSACNILYFIQISDFEKFVLEEKIFKVLRSDVLQALNLPKGERYVSYNELNKSRGQLEIYASRKDGHPATQEMQRLLSNVQLFESIQRGDFKVAEATPEQTRKFGAEVFYNHANFALVAFILAFLGCLLASVNSIFKRRALDVAANSMAAAVAVTLSVAFALRLYIAGRPPLSSLYEIVLLVALLLESFEFGAFLFCRKRTFSLIVPVTMMATILLFFAKFVLEPGDLFQPIPAILNSGVFLTLHVFAIALGFSGVILSGVVAHLYLFRLNRSSSHEPRTSNLAHLLYGTLVFGSVFTIIGTLLGGVWADFAWGRFWGFDPKECGALFVILWTMLGLHLRGGRIIDERGFALFNAFNVIVTFLCWFGINLLGVGLHSYGFQNGTLVWLGAFMLADSLIVLFLQSGRGGFRRLH